MKLTNISTIKELMQRHGMTFSKALGQNFLINPTVCPRMAEEGGVTPETGVLEIGPGIGVLTQELAARGKKVVAIELDKRLLPILEETLADCPNVTVLQGDVMKLNLPEILATHFAGMEVVVCANLPYYITSPILMMLLEQRLPLKSITAMVQKEAAERICAPIPSRAMGAITAAVAFYADPHVLFSVSKGSFLPSPKVDSSVIRLDVRAMPPVALTDDDAFFRTVKAAFVQRRKTLANSLSAGLGIPKADGIALLEQAGVNPGLRGEQLTLEQFAQIANILAESSF